MLDHRGGGKFPGGEPRRLVVLPVQQGHPQRVDLDESGVVVVVDVAASESGLSRRPLSWSLDRRAPTPCLARTALPDRRLSGGLSGRPAGSAALPGQQPVTSTERAPRPPSNNGSITVLCVLHHRKGALTNVGYRSARLIVVPARSPGRRVAATKVSIQRRRLPRSADAGRKCVPPLGPRQTVTVVSSPSSSWALSRLGVQRS